MPWIQRYLAKFHTDQEKAQGFGFDIKRRAAGDNCLMLGMYPIISYIANPAEDNRLRKGIRASSINTVGLSLACVHADRYLTPERKIDMPKLLTAFQQFFRENADAWIERFDYKEAGPQLLLQAFLQRIINGGGRISREYGLGRKRTDLLIEWPLGEKEGYHGQVQHIVLELKILYKSLENTLHEGGCKQWKIRGMRGKGSSPLLLVLK